MQPFTLGERDPQPRRGRVYTASLPADTLYPFVRSCRRSTELRLAVLATAHSRGLLGPSCASARSSSADACLANQWRDRFSEQLTCGRTSAVRPPPLPASRCRPLHDVQRPTTPVLPRRIAISNLLHRQSPFVSASEPALHSTSSFDCTFTRLAPRAATSRTSLSLPGGTRSACPLPQPYSAPVLDR